MALYRTVSLAFWSDPKVQEEFTPEDKYFFLYLMTNPHTNLAGCYEIGFKTMADETGYSKETISRLIDRFENVHNVISYSPDTKELLLFNWHKHNWTSSEKYRKPLLKQINCVKNPDFKVFLSDLFEGKDTVSIPYRYNCIDTTNTITNTNTSTNTNSLSITNTNTVNNLKEKNSKNSDYLEIIESKGYSPQVVEVLTEWLEYKAEKKQSYKATGFKSFLTKVDKMLDEYGEQVTVESFYDAMSNNWAGVYPKKATDGKKSGSAYMDAIKNRIEVVDSWV